MMYSWSFLSMLIDMLFTSPNEKHFANFTADWHESFEMSDFGHLRHYLGILFMQGDGRIALGQPKYIEILL
mgnify:CR=1 FL=1